MLVGRQTESQEAEKRLPDPRYLSGSEIAAVLRLLGELRSSTLSRATHSLATDLMIKLGSAEQLSKCSFELAD